MRRLLVGLCVLAAATLAAGADEGNVSAATKAYKEIEKDLLDQNKTVRDVKKRTELYKTFAGKFLAHAEKNPKDDSAFDALMYVLQLSQPSKDKDDPGTKAMAIVKQNHLKSKKIGRYLGLFAFRGDEGVAMIKTIIAEHPDKKMQAKAVKAMVQGREQFAQMGERLKGNEKMKEQFEAARGKDFVKDLVDNAAKYAKEAKEYSKMLKEKYPDAFPEIVVGKAAPEVVSQDLEGKEVKLSQLKGKVVVLDIWATWCGPCVGMIPHSKKLVEKMKDKPFVFISVSADDKKDTLTAFIKKTPMPWTHWWVGASEGLVEDWQVEAFPTIYVIDAKGVIREKIVGADSNKIDTVAEMLVKEAEEAKKAKTE